MKRACLASLPDFELVLFGSEDEDTYRIAVEGGLIMIWRRYSNCASGRK